MTEENLKDEFKMPEFKSSADMMISEVHALLSIIKEDSFRSPKPRYPETRFRQYFAPFFIGGLEVPEGENIQALWAGEVGTLHTEVEITDPQGNVLFTVPPLMNLETIDLRTTGVSRVRFASINQVFEEDSRNFPEKARVDYYQSIGQKLSTVFKGIAPDPEHAEKWLKIFSFYNVTPPSSDQFKIVANESFKDPNDPSSTTSGKKPNWSNIGILDFNPSFD